jgi:hypothetical protein
MSAQTSILWLAVAGVAGCGTTHVYLPTEHATATLAESGMPAANYQVPPGAPRGEVKVATLGLQKMKGTEERNLVVRMVVTNNSNEPWQVDVRQQRIFLPNGHEQGPQQAFGVPQGSPFVVVPARQQRSVDLTYAVGRDKPQSYALRWALTTPNEWVTNRTAFRRTQIGFYGYGPPLYGGYFYAPFYYTYPTFPYYGFGFGPVAARERATFSRTHFGRPRAPIAPAGRVILTSRPGRL